MKRDKAFFHVHTRRCGHAGTDPDEAYIERAIAMGAKRIVFTDHAPFPGDPFDSRMEIGELDEYLDTLNRLRVLYKDYISVGVGLEIEYLPGFDDYYLRLYQEDQLDFMMIGQHFFRDANGDYSFYYKRSKLLRDEPKMLSQAIVDGLSTGMFPYVAHPDRIFRKRFVWNDGLSEISEQIVRAAEKTGAVLEKNISSYRKGLFRPQFWDVAADRVKTIVGIDAHTVEDLKLYEDGAPFVNGC